MTRFSIFALTASAAALALAACGDPEAPSPAAPDGVPEEWEQSAPVTAPEAGEGEAADEDAGDVPGIGEGDALPPADGASGAGAIDHDPSVVRWDGFGAADFGEGEEAVRMSWGRPLTAGEPAEGASCYMLFQDPQPPEGRGIAFMFEDDGFRRYEVDVEPLITAHVAPGDISVGDEADAVTAAFDDVEEAPHKYVEGGRTLSVDAPQGDTRLVFETDADGRIASWRIGQTPQVDYVEGCG